MYLNLLMTNRCNAHCDHCAPESGPLDLRELSLEEVFSYITQAASIVPEHRRLGLSGGEVFLHYPRLIRIVEFATQKKFEVTITSNAFWARTVEGALEKLRPLRELGLSVLAISRSQFHERYIPIARLRNCLLAASELGQGVVLKVVVTRSHPLSRLLEGLDDALAVAGARVETIPCYPFGRANEQVPASELYTRPDIPMLPCPGARFTITPSGDAYPCCNLDSKAKLLNLGNVREQSISGLYQAFSRSSLMRIIHDRGPGYFVPAIRERGLGHKLGHEYVGICQLCHQIASDPELVEVARDVAEQEESLRTQENYHRYMASFQTALSEMEKRQKQTEPPIESSTAQSC
jgi:MoaA/NifB/PqqE/SkfB family radical SAM enzyme